MAKALRGKSLFQSAVLRTIDGELAHEQLPVIKNNKDILTQLTETIAASNKDFFYQKLQQCVQRNLNFLHVIDSNTNTLTDEFGRGTYFYVNIGPYKIHVYQPGTPTFLSSINDGNELVTTHDNCQQNGPILGMGCGCFLAKFVTQLSSTYQKNCVEECLDAHDFHPEVYEKSLETCLKIFVDEDRDDHGRLLEMKHTLLNIGGEYVVKSEQLEFYFYAKDIEVYRGRISDTITQAEKINLSDMSDVNLMEIKNNRRQYSTYQQTEKYQQTSPMNNNRRQYSIYQQAENYLQISLVNQNRKLNFIESPTWSVIRAKILTKNGIFEDLSLTRDRLTNFMDTIENEIRQSNRLKQQIRVPIICPKKNVSKKCCTIL